MRLARLAAHMRGPRLSAIQVEVTSRCTLRCVMCPRTALGARWRSADLSWATFERVARAFVHARFVHLQGWGEPLLHRRLVDMIAVAKAAGCGVGFTTNGMLLDAALGARLLDVGPDMVAVSLAGAIAPTHEAIRVGSDFARIVDNVRRLVAQRAARRTARPTIEILFLMTTTNVAELPSAVDLAASIGADRLVATNLDYVVTAQHEALKAFGRAPAADLARHVDAARARARAARLGFTAYPLEPSDTAVCDASPLGTVFVCADGSVSPCAWIGLVGQSTVTRWTDGRSIDVPRACFGNLATDDLAQIWNAAAYRAFRAAFAARRAALVAQVALGTNAAGASGAVSTAMLPAAPEPCVTCEKLRGF